MAIPQTTSSDHAVVAAGGYQGQIEVLARRLENGWQLIDLRTSAGEDVEELELLWLRLLGEYEQLYNLAS
jgi:hypothetical protein